MPEHHETHTLRCPVCFAEHDCTKHGAVDMAERIESELRARSRQDNAALVATRDELRGSLDQLLRAYEMVWLDEGGSRMAFELCGSVKRARAILAKTTIT